MPSIKRKICMKHGIYETKSCSQCKSERNKIYDETARNQDSYKIYHSTRWKKVRAKRLRLTPLCINFDVCGNVAAIVDHVVELKDGGAPYSLDNTRSMCIACHNTKTAEERKKRAE